MVTTGLCPVRRFPLALKRYVRGPLVLKRKAIFSPGLSSSLDEIGLAFSLPFSCLFHRPCFWSRFRSRDVRFHFTPRLACLAFLSVPSGHITFSFQFFRGTFFDLVFSLGQATWLYPKLFESIAAKSLSSKSFIQRCPIDLT